MSQMSHLQFWLCITISSRNWVHIIVAPPENCFSKMEVRTQLIWFSMKKVYIFATIQNLFCIFFVLSWDKILSFTTKWLHFIGHWWEDFFPASLLCFHPRIKGVSLPSTTVKFELTTHYISNSSQFIHRNDLQQWVELFLFFDSSSGSLTVSLSHLIIDLSGNQR